MDKILKRLNELSVTLPKINQPVNSYIATKTSGNIIYISGQVPRLNGKDLYIGKVGDTIDVDSAYEAAKICAINIISQLNNALDGNLSLVKSCIRLRGFVNSVSDFKQHPQVINGASDFMVEVFGESGRHARTAIGVGSLPHNFSVEVDAEFELHDEISRQNS
ncbi:TPA: RidA family protein [Klebsiella pneumoniae]|uniref:RidA family protein n=1 Tax=Klebsiella TaxID=570 RepID=UPI001FF00961|nr:RidA family protein [Klebsiella oxytoca]EKU9430751.1 RidA family protein [Klebsiella variicola]EKW9957657.1 RidA family protein [Klebsiella pneumoniae]HCM3804524.1 RidA family protein [Klebsiella variicola subsp. variicola]ELP0881833.1 RidA family protein [Klebsiella pneumoniae]MBZ6673308.1 RidA family protein [Klebsiella pneumoniae]